MKIKAEGNLDQNLKSKKTESCVFFIFLIEREKIMSFNNRIKISFLKATT